MGKNSRIALKAIAITIVLLIAYIFLPLITAMVVNPPGEEYLTIPAELKFEFERVIDISARTFTINITVPTNNEFQNISVLDQSGYPKEIFNQYNRTWWSYSMSGSAHIKIRYSGETYAKYWNIKESKGENAIPQYLKNQYDHKEYLRGDNGNKRYVINPEAFKNITEKLTAGKKDVVSKLRAIYDEIVQNFHYVTERSGNPKTAVETWNSKGGDCDELSFVFVSMARSIGIPAWVEYGLLYNGTTWAQHAWVKTVIPADDKLNYVNIDLTVEVGHRDLGRGFLIRDPYRITEWVDDGNSTHLSGYYSYVMYTYPPQLSINENIHIISMKEIGKMDIPVGQQIPSWLMALIFLVLFVAAVAIIVRW